MKISKQGTFAALSMCAASALAPAAQAAAADNSSVPVPVDVPLESVETALPVADAPTVFATVPSSPLTTPTMPPLMQDERVTVPAVPALGAVLDSPALTAEAPVPGLDGTAAQLSTGSEALHTVTPALSADLPLTNPARSSSGFTDVTTPGARLTTPTVQGERTARVDLVNEEGDSQLPDALGTATALLDSTVPTL
ncbi:MULTISPECIES: hypothetical protein [unclassified Streptomyces]|uniref:hypothetical protein n=1 Tax=unclassified Streptomyces TaxID=2593676 RepID=UPI0022B64B04|nr:MULTISPECIES: hypothetical protein [unclassified Streptomyces]MCZ7417134.1 hypothetical protein [Streptomyces sp. WMMC897]MCZ7417911.1 hypothetical protein [Streptomyces sp. WMMC897]MCZ7433038.1 hypothetical protein [Streptomyces sp. WMMC1477]